MKELLEEEDKDAAAAAAVAQKKKQGKRAKSGDETLPTDKTGAKRRNMPRSRRIRRGQRQRQRPRVRVSLKEYMSAGYLKKRMMMMAFLDESPAKRKSKSKGEKAGDQGASACKTAPWATEAKEAGATAAGVGVEAKSWPPPLQADVEQAPAS
jgi:hypothetical protein